MNPIRIADSAAGISISSALISWFSVANEIAQFVAAVVAIISGLAAAWYYFKRR